MAECKQNIDEFLERKIGDWNGLASGCRRNEITSWFSFNEGEGLASRGSDRVDYTYRSLTDPAFHSPVFFYFEGEALSFVETDFWSFDREECAELLQQLGPPPDKLDLYWTDKQVADSEWVYVDKGITVAVIPATQLIARLKVYSPTTLDVYKKRYYSTSLRREFRKR